MNDFEEIKKQLKKELDSLNSREVDSFEGLSPFEMHFLLYDTFGENSPIEITELSLKDYEKIPLLNQVKYLLKIIEEKKELKLTAKGNLPTKYVADIYNQGFLKDESIEKGYARLYKEEDCMSINLTRILIELSGLVKKRKNKLSLTKKGWLAIANSCDLFSIIFQTFGKEFNWAYFDRYGNNQVGQFGFSFSLILLSKLGSKKRNDFYYANKYFKAFPELINQVNVNPYTTQEEDAFQCYSLRTFDRFLEYFGVIKIDCINRYNSEKFITKTKLFDKLIKIKPHTKVIE